MKVEYVDHWGDDLRVANVARVSFNKWKEGFDERDSKLIHYLASHAHTSPFRHVGLSIRCEAPVFIARQAQKHVVGLAWNEVSRRYVDADPEFYYPDCWRSRPDGSVKQGSGGPVEYQEDWNDRYEEYITTAKWLYSYMLKSNIAPEQARMILPQSMMTSWCWTGSVQAFFHFWKLRIEEHAQKEIQIFAEQVGEICEKYFPVSWRALKDAV